MTMKLNIAHIFTYGMLCLGLWSCSKVEVPGEPYGPGKEPLGVTINRSQVPSPAAGLPGSEVTIAASGLLPFREELIFRINGELAEVVDVNESHVTVRVPDFASTGSTSVSIGDVVIFGPRFTVTGKINPDPTFVASQGADNAVNKILFTSDGRMLIVGAFTNYDNKGIVRPINRIARTFADGTYDASLRSGTGANGQIGYIIPFNNRYLIAGGFNGYAQRGTDISNLTLIHQNGAIDTMGVSPFRRPEQADTTKYYPTFNGGFDGYVARLHAQNDKVVVNGSFRYHISRQYDKPNRLETRDSVIVDSVEIRQLARLNADGSLDRTYRFDPGSNRPLEGGNGNALAVFHTNGNLAGKATLHGNFSRFDGVTVGRIVRVNVNGLIDDTFNPGGAGADQTVNSVSYNPANGKYMIAGSFRSYNGQAVNQVAMLNEDGSLDATFVAKEFIGGSFGPTFVKQLSDGKIIVAGDFYTYGGIARNGFMVLDENGNLIPGYNATGSFNGFIEDIVETTSADGKRALYIHGWFSEFDGEPVNNFIRVLID